jgi:hypothetical protein
MRPIHLWSSRTPDGVRCAHFHSVISFSLRNLAGHWDLSNTEIFYSKDAASVHYRLKLCNYDRGCILF